MQMATGFWVSFIVTNFAKMGLADHLKDAQPKTVSELAKAIGSNERFLFRFLRAAASLGVAEQVDFASELDKASFKITELSQLLRSDHPQSVRDMMMLLNTPSHVMPWVDLQYAVTNGTDSFVKNFGKDFWSYTNEHADEMKIFNGAMSNMARGNHAAFLEAYDLTGVNKMVDVGGGHGALLASVLTKYPSMQGVVFDRPNVVEAESQFEKPEDIKKRLQFVGGDFFVSVPEGGDAYIMSMILHDWGDDACHKILTSIHKAMPQGARLLVVDCVVPKDNSMHMSKLMDLNMMTITDGGRERTHEEFVELYAKAGFRLSRIVPTKGFASVVEGFKA